MMTGISNPFPRPDQGSWLETIALFEAIREGNQAAALRLLQTSAAREAVLGGLLGLIELYFRNEEDDKVEGFLAAAHSVGPPPAFGCKPFLP
ncbi:hypothetical protein [Corynebacterium striatum]|uniref:hypothetical protein n=1 Tax=Corynebacterium striatum TaxID=43770 RepID=UPI003B59A9E4